MKTVGDSPDLFQSLLGEGLQAGQCLAARLRQYCGAFVQHFQVQLDAGERLARAGVQFTGNSRPLPLQFAQDGPS